VLLVVSDELGCLKSDLFEDVADEGVHDVHRSLGDTGFGVHLLEDSVDVDGESFGSLSSATSCLGGGFLCLGGGGLSA